MEHPLNSIRHGYLEVICGCMYSGKTEELIRQLRRCEYARQNYQVFKPVVDDRYSEDEVCSHNQDSISAQVIEDIYDLYRHLRHDTQVVGIDEAQFFSDDILEVVNKLVKNGRRVIIAGLDTDWKGRPFGPMPNLLACADLIHKQYAICMVCGEAATRTQRLVNEDKDILVGSFRVYEARCRRHFDPDLSFLQKPPKNPPPLRPV
ncbi:MAG: thymidine kinase [Bdellovibrionales bacterium]|nr:thymidine kinase [Bdellovibrionales bacterium]